MNMQIRFTPVEERENQIHMLELQQQAEQARLAQSLQSAPAPRRTLLSLIRRVGRAVAHNLWVIEDEVRLELADMLRGHRPHLHHHRHAH